ncbi:MAG: methyltransferase [Pseudaminobacter sp.]
MAKLTKAQAKAHQQACDLLAKDVLTDDDKLFVLENWQESAKHINTIAGAFFTPPGLARDFCIETYGPRIIDLCAGIGALSLRALWHHEAVEIVCVELNPEYVEVGKKLLPEATWVVGSVFDLPNLGHFDCAIGNPPFGATPRQAKAPRYTGNDFEYHVIDIASGIADYGVFIVPQMSAPFCYSGHPCFEVRESDKYRRFVDQTGIKLTPNCGIDTSVYANDWHGVSVAVEIVTADFAEARERRQPSQANLFMEAAE